MLFLQNSMTMLRDKTQQTQFRVQHTFIKHHLSSKITSCNQWNDCSKMWWRSMRTDSWGRRRGTNPVYSPSCSLHHSAPPLLAPRCAAKLSRLRRGSSIRRPAPSSLVVPGGGREERRLGRRRTGQVEALSIPTTRHFTPLGLHALALNWVLLKPYRRWYFSLFWKWKIGQ